MSLKTSLLLLSILLMALARQRGHDESEPEIHDIAEDSPSAEGRMLATGFPFRINAFYGFIPTTSAYRSYFQTRLIPPILDYFSHALTIKYKLTNGIKLTTTTMCSGAFTVPSELKTGLQTDFYWIVDTDTESSNWIAESGRCSITSGSNRPYIGKTIVNTYVMNVPALDDVLLNEKNMICMMHEFVHNLGFAETMLKYWLDANGNQRSGHTSTKTLDGKSSLVLNVEPLTSMLRAHFGCPTLTGAYLENGDTVGAHLERRHFGIDLMTSGLVYEKLLSKNILGLLEGTGWYFPDYSYGDNFAWGQGQGCDFLFKSCSSTGFSYEEFCTGSGVGCSVAGAAGGSCYADPLADGCRFIRSSVQDHCEEPDAASFARLGSAEVFGRTSGSKCFSGTLSSSSSGGSTATFCFNYKCVGSGASTTLNVAVGSKTATCTKAGVLSVSGYAGYINCPDPVLFCATVGSKQCTRGCMGRGTCVDGKCACNAGFTGKDCALNA